MKLSGSKYAAWWISASSVIQTVGFIIALPSHIGDPTWSAHAQFHLFLSVLWLSWLNGLILILTWGPLQEHKRWSYWSALVGFVAAQGGYFLAMLLVWEGRPYETWYHFALGANTIIGILGFWLMRRAVWPKSAA